MSLYESNSAETNEALPNNLNYTHSTQDTEVILRLPDLNQFVAKSSGSTSPQDSSSNVPSSQLESERWETEMVARSKFLGTTSSSGKDRKWKIAKFTALAIIVLLLGVGITHVVARFYARATENYDCPAPDAEEAPSFKPQYAGNENTTSIGSPSFDLPVNLDTPSLPQTSNTGSLSADTNYNAPYDVSAARQLVPPGASGANPARFATSPNMTTTIPEGPNVSRAPIFSNHTIAQGNGTVATRTSNPYPNTANNPHAATSAESYIKTYQPVSSGGYQNTYHPQNAYSANQQQPYPPTNGYNPAPATQVTNANRFSPERVQEVLRNQNGAVQTANYPQAPMTPPNGPTSYYPQNSVPTVAQRPNAPSYPVHTAYPVPGSSATVPPVSPYPPAGNAYPATTTVQNQTSQNWPAQPTNVTPSTPPTQPIYPTTGNQVPNTATTPPYYQGQFYR